MGKVFLAFGCFMEVVSSYWLAFASAFGEESIHVDFSGLPLPMNQNHLGSQ